MNLYDGTYEPPAWDEWRSIDTGTGPALEPGQMTDVFSDQAGSLVRRRAGTTPFYLQVAPVAPHEPALPYPRHSSLFAGEKTPQHPFFGERNVSDKPGYVSKLKPLTRDEIVSFNELHRNRLRSMMAVDEMVGRLVATLRETEGSRAPTSSLPRTTASTWATTASGRAKGSPTRRTSRAYSTTTPRPHLRRVGRGQPPTIAGRAFAGAAARTNDAAGSLEDGFPRGGRPPRADRAPRLSRRQDTELSLRPLRERGEGTLQPGARPLRAQELR